MGEARPRSVGGVQSCRAKGSAPFLDPTYASGTEGSIGIAGFPPVRLDDPAIVV